jgi:hypothetical protein
VTFPTEIANRLQASFDTGKRRLMEPTYEDWELSYLSKSPYAVQGALAWWEPGQCITWLDSERAPYTLGDVARRWVRQGVGATPATPFSGMYPLLKIPQPLYYIGGEVRGDYAYVDLRRAYYSLYVNHTYDMAVTITPNRIIALEGRISLEAPEIDWVLGDSDEHTEARHSIVGLARMNRQFIIRYGRIKMVTGSMITTSAGLWAYIALQLQAIAQETIKSFGCVHVSTDGYIVPAHIAEPLQSMLAERWNLDSQVEGIGDTYIAQLCRYRVGKKRAGRKGPIFGNGEPTDNLLYLNRDQRDSLARKRFE